jgi:hypothetical protein
VHAAHGLSHEQTQVVHLQVFRKEQVLRLDHIVVIVVRESGVQAITWLTRFAVAYRIRRDYVISICIEQLTRAKQLVGKTLVAQVPPAL